MKEIRIAKVFSQKSIILFIIVFLLFQCAPEKKASLKAMLGLLTTGTIENPSQFSIGGTVLNLTGAGLILQNNSKDDLSISASGNFTFTSSLADNTSYSVTISTQPANQTCTLANATGTIASANITSISVSCANTGNANGTLSNGTIINP